MFLESFFSKVQEVRSVLFLLTRYTVVLKLQGKCHERDTFFESQNILVSTFYACVTSFKAVQKLFIIFLIINFVFASVKLLTNFETLLKMPFSVLISKEQAKTLSLIFSSTQKQKMQQPPEHVQKVLFYYYKPSKNIHLVTHSL